MLIIFTPISICLINCYRKFVLISFIAVCAIAFVQGNVFKGFADDAIYEAIRVVLKRQYPDNEEKTKCMVDDFRRNKVADKFYTIDLLTNQEKLSQEVNYN
jgi:hypothetical protein